jgi:phage virion morphogenesis protein
MSFKIVELEGQAAVIAQLDAVAAKLVHREEFWRDIGEEVRSQTQLRFENSTGPEGQKWPESWRVKMGLGGGRLTLVDSGDMRKDLVLNVSEQGGEFGSPTPYALIHQYGGTIHAKTSKGLYFGIKSKGGNRDRLIRKQSVTIPARPFLGINEENGNRLLDIAERWLGAAQ